MDVLKSPAIANHYYLLNYDNIPITCLQIEQIETKNMTVPLQ